MNKFSAGPDDPDRGLRVRRTKTNIVRTRTGCQNCRKRRRKCDEGRPQCQGCVKRGIKCSGYERTIAFKDVSSLAAESSRKFEAARWAALRAEDERPNRKRRRTEIGSPSRVETLSSSDPGSDHDYARSSSSSSPSGPVFAMPRLESARHYRRDQPSSSTQQASASFSHSYDTQLPPIDPSLFQPSPVTYTSHELDDSPSVVVATTPKASESPPDEEPSTIVPYVPTLPTLSPSLPTLVIRDTPENENTLIQHFETHLLPNLPVPMSFGPEYMSNSCFRHAILALSCVNRFYLDKRTQEGHANPELRVGQSAVGREHYLCAVSELYHSLDLSDPVSREHHAAAALMLAYYEIETGSPYGSLRHARGLDALLSKLDLAPSTADGRSAYSGPSAMPQIFKAWRILRMDLRCMAMPYRRSSVHYNTDVHDAYNFLDPQLAIRHVYTRAFTLMGRVNGEASFTPSPDKGSASKQAAIWVRDTGGRVCDTRHVQTGDYHRDTITGDEVLAQCARFTRELDAWHASLPVADRPVLKVDGPTPFVTPRGGETAFDPIPVLTFTGGDRKAFEYMMYVTARLIVSYLQSVFPTEQQGSTAAETAVWAQVVFGVVCGMQHRQQMFSYINACSNVAQAAMLCEGAGPVNAVLEGVIPYVLGNGIPVAELAEWLYTKKGLEIVRRERLRGRSIRSMLLTLDEDYEKGHFDTRCAFLGFGDYSGRGHFRDVYSLD